MKNYKFLLLVIICLIIAYIVVGKNRTETINNSPQIINQTNPTKNLQQKITQQPTSTIQSQQVSKPVSQGSCRDGDSIRQNVKACSADLECYSLVSYNERFCRLPDGTCKFFCSDK